MLLDPMDFVFDEESFLFSIHHLGYRFNTLDVP